MGMAASQARFLQLTCRNNDIGAELSRLANSKVSLTRDMQKVSREYQLALNQKTLKWSNNSGVSYMELSYNNLMQPSLLNNYNPYIVTNQNGSVVINPAYKKYAEIISPNGAPGGDWLSNRTAILSELTGINPYKINNIEPSQQEVIDAENKVNQLKEDEPILKSSAGGTSIATLMGKLGSETYEVGGTKITLDWKKVYNNNIPVILGNNSTTASAAFAAHIGKLTDNIKPYFPNQQTEFNNAVKAVLAEYMGLISKGTNLTNSAGAVTKNDEGTYFLHYKNLIDTLWGSLKAAGCTNKDGEVAWYDVNSSEYQDWKTKHDAWQVEYNNAMQDYNAKRAGNNGLLTADEQSKIDFYDDLFSAIADNGWVLNENIDKPDYLNQLLQNGMYTITTVSKDTVYDPATQKYKPQNKYEMHLASNFDKIYSVNDDENKELALAEYEHKKSIINTKETRIDTRMSNLQTEQSAIKQMLESIKQVKNDNIERTFNTTG